MAANCRCRYPRKMISSQKPAVALRQNHTASSRCVSGSEEAQLLPHAFDLAGLVEMHQLGARARARPGRRTRKRPAYTRSQEEIFG